MVHRRKKPGKYGDAAKYLTRTRAMKKLQLTMHDYRKLCIYKGVYPREPKNRKKAQKGETTIKTLYLKEDVQYLLSEPIIWTFRKQKTHARKIRTFKALREKDNLQKAHENKPLYRLDHIVRERYPTFIDAIRDLDDILKIIFLFKFMPSNRYVHTEPLEMCSRLAMEFMNYVIEARALRKVFISIKGYYYQAEIMSVPVTWIIPHPFQPPRNKDVDMSVMSNFIEIYITTFGFINYRLYQTLNLCYPPTLLKEKKEDDDDNATYGDGEDLYALSQSIRKGDDDDKGVIDDEEVQLDVHLMEPDEKERYETLQAEKESIDKLKNLFNGLKFFLNREINRESVTFVVRSCGGMVSWSKYCGDGFSFDETDQSITHQVVDRDDTNRPYLSRYYIQPQWIYDCVNARMLLPVQDYFPGTTLPAHLSPFDKLKEGAYVPPEEEELNALKAGKELPVIPEDSETETESDDDDDDDDEEEEENDDIEDVDMDETKGQADLEHMSVVKAKSIPVNQTIQKKEKAIEELRLRELMIPSKERRVYKGLRRTEFKHKRRNTKLQSKRNALESEKKKDKKSGKKSKI